MSAARSPLPELGAALQRFGAFGVLQGTGALASERAQGEGGAPVLSLDWPELERLLPDGGLPRGVVEIACPVDKIASGSGLRTSASAVAIAIRGGATTIALSAMRAVHTADPQAWCAWVSTDTVPSLYAPAVVQAGVDLERLLVVRPDATALARTVVKVAASGAFDLVVIDAMGPSGLDGRVALREGWSGGKSVRSRVDGSVVVRRLSLAAEEKGTSFIVLTNLYASRAVPWPVAMRLEVERRPEAIAMRITKDRRGRASSQHVVRVAC